MTTIARRSFLQRLTAAAVLLGFGTLPFGLSRLITPVDPGTVERAGKIRHRRNYLRPPGALKNDAAFVSACIGCGLCAEVCPPDCIKFHARDGGAKVNTPFIDPSAKSCTLCNKCMEVCPTNALTITDRRQVDMGIAQIDRTACFPWVDRGICGACVTVCPLGQKAIGFDFANIYRPVVKSACVGCGQCVEVCPHPSKPIWIVQRDQNPHQQKQVS